MTKHRRNNKRKNWGGKGFFSVFEDEGKEANNQTKEDRAVEEISDSDLSVDAIRMRDIAKDGLYLGKCIPDHAIHPRTNNYFTSSEVQFLIKMIGDGSGVYLDSTLPQIALTSAIVLNRNYLQIMRKIEDLWRTDRIKMYPRKKDCGEVPWTRRQYLASIQYYGQRLAGEHGLRKARSISFLSTTRRSLLEKSIMQNPYATPEMIAFTLCCPYWGPEFGNEFAATIRRQISPLFKLIHPEQEFYRDLLGISPASLTRTIYDFYGQFFSYMYLADCQLWSLYGISPRSTRTKMAVVDLRKCTEIRASLLEFERSGNLFRYSEGLDKSGFLNSSDYYQAYRHRFSNAYNYDHGDIIQSEAIDSAEVSAREIAASSLVAKVVEVPKIVEVAEESKIISTEGPANSLDPDLGEAIDLLKNIRFQVGEALNFKAASLSVQGKTLLSLYQATAAEKKQTELDLIAIQERIDQAITNLSNQSLKPDLESIREKITEEVRRDLMRKLFSNVVTISDKNS